jgi:hypothetical protein
MSQRVGQISKPGAQAGGFALPWTQTSGKTSVKNKIKQFYEGREGTNKKLFFPSLSFFFGSSGV